MEDVKKSVARWLHEKAEPLDEVTLATASGDVWWSDRIERGRSDLEAVLGRVKGKKLSDRTREWISDWEAYRIVNFEDATGAAAASNGPAPTEAGPPGGPAPPNPNLLGSIMARVAGRTDLGQAQVRMRAMETYNRLNARMGSVLGATERLSRGLAGTRGRKSILIFSEGFLYDANKTALVDRAIDASQRGNTAIYFVDAKGLAGQDMFGADRTRAPEARDVGIVSMEENFLETSRHRARGREHRRHVRPEHERPLRRPRQGRRGVLDLLPARLPAREVARRQVAQARSEGRAAGSQGEDAARLSGDAPANRWPPLELAGHGQEGLATARRRR